MGGRGRDGPWDLNSKIQAVLGVILKAWEFNGPNLEQMTLFPLNRSYVPFSWDCHQFLREFGHFLEFWTFWGRFGRKTLFLMQPQESPFCRVPVLCFRFVLERFKKGVDFGVAPACTFGGFWGFLVDFLDFPDFSSIFLLFPLFFMNFYVFSIIPGPIT